MKNKSELKILIYSLLISIIILSITSKNSFFYPFNDWVDANAFFTVGKGIFKGVVPYRDLFEQKGLILYFIYGLGSLISYRTFHGVFLLEILFFTAFLYYASKIIRLFINEKYTYLILPILSFLITTSIAFVHGGSAEEFSLPFLTISLYYYLKYFFKKEYSKTESLISGICCGCIIMIKYTLVGLWVGIVFLLFIDSVLKKNLKSFLKFFLYFVIGNLIPISICLIYLGCNHAIKDFIECYLTINITAYNREAETIILKITTLYQKAIGSLLDNGFIIFFLIIWLPLLIKNFKISSHNKINIVLLIAFQLLLMYWGLRFYRYYLLPLLIMLIISLTGLFSCLDKRINKYLKSPIFKYIALIINILAIFLSYYFSNYKNMLFSNFEDMWQYKYAKYINQYDNATLLNAGYLDAGLYTSSGLLPSTRFFEVQNIPYENFPDNLDEIKDTISNQKVMFVLYYTKDSIEEVKEENQYLFDNYDLKFSSTQKSEDETYNAFLFEVKNN